MNRQGTLGALACRGRCTSTHDLSESGRMRRSSWIMPPRQNTSALMDATGACPSISGGRNAGVPLRMQRHAFCWRQKRGERADPTF